MSGMTIGKLAAAEGVSVETVRFYQRRGLLAEPERHGSGYREYSDADRSRLVFIRRARQLGFSLGEIADLLGPVHPDDIARAADLAGLAPDIASFPEGYGTIIGERGITLSGGQKQRVAIARAILRNPKILILDDALASVDTLTEERILQGLTNVMRGRTTILISHRVSTVQNASRIFVIEHGEVAEQGTHAELIRSGGYYADLYQKQLLEEELETI